MLYPIYQHHWRVIVLALLKLHAHELYKVIEFECLVLGIKALVNSLFDSPICHIRIFFYLIVCASSQQNDTVKNMLE
jgi:hypothetical protein